MQRGAELALGLGIGVVGQEQTHQVRIAGEDRTLQRTKLGRRRFGQEQGREEHKQSDHRRFAKAGRNLTPDHSISTGGQE